ncbi:putative metal-binding motif-containing protein [Candidatus Uhrbacteria bacterium]|nr:putative metal-binding motif-containing protein [Candidatus Uhrbacteria bacterium]
MPACPGAEEALCDGMDTNCSGDSFPLEADNDGDGYAECGGDCSDLNPSIHPGGNETCDGTDNDCDGETDETADDDGDGYLSAISCATGDDCDDTNSAIHPGASESCNGVDQNCNGMGDEPYTTYYFDGDGDGFAANGAASQSLCAPAGSYSALVTGDCADGSANTYPGAYELCDGTVDNDCDGLLDYSEGCNLATLTFYDDDCNLGCSTTCPVGSGTGYLDFVSVEDGIVTNLPTNIDNQAAQVDVLVNVSCASGYDINIEVYADDACSVLLYTYFFPCTWNNAAINLNCPSSANADDNVECVVVFLN